MQPHDSELRLTDGDSRALHAVWEMPLVSTGELAGRLDVVYSAVSRRMIRLEKLGLVESVRMGAVFSAARRYRLTPDGARRFPEPELYFHRTRSLNALASFLPAVESFYFLALVLPALSDTGKLQSFHWRFREGADAMVHYEGGTAAFLWSGPWQDSAGLEDRMLQFTKAVPLTGGWPALICVVACDYWQACRVNEFLADDLDLKDGAFVVCLKTHSILGNPRMRRGASTLALRPLYGALPNIVPAETPRMLRGVLTGGESPWMHRIIRLVEQFPGARAGSISRALGSHRRYVAGKLKRLVEEDLLLQFDGHYYLTDAAMVILAHRDRVHPEKLRRRFGLHENGLPSVARYRKHDAATFSIVSVFQAGGFPVASGWRGEDYSGGRNAIAPDALVYMGKNSSGGGGWYYLEYERRADSTGAVSRKLRGYLSLHNRKVTHPVLVAARSDKMADEFRRQAAAVGYPLWATSIPSLRVNDPGTIWGPETVWLDSAGKPAAFLPPR